MERRKFLSILPGFPMLVNALAQNKDFKLPKPEIISPALYPLHCLEEEYKNKGRQSYTPTRMIYYYIFDEYGSNYQNWTDDPNQINQIWNIQATRNVWVDDEQKSIYGFDVPLSNFGPATYLEIETKENPGVRDLALIYKMKDTKERYIIVYSDYEFSNDTTDKNGKHLGSHPCGAFAITYDTAKQIGKIFADERFNS